MIEIDEKNEKHFGLLRPADEKPVVWSYAYVLKVLCIGNFESTNSPAPAGDN